MQMIQEKKVYCNTNQAMDKLYWKDYKSIIYLNYENLRYDKSKYICVSELIDVEDWEPLEVVLKWIICDGDESREHRG